MTYRKFPEGCTRTAPRSLPEYCVEFNGVNAPVLASIVKDDIVEEPTSLMLPLTANRNVPPGFTAIADKAVLPNGDPATGTTAPVVELIEAVWIPLVSKFCPVTP